MTKCLIQSYFRQKQGSGTSGNGNLLLVHLQSHAPFTPTRLSFTGSCNDSANNTEFLMVKKIINRSLIVTLRWNYKQQYAIAFRNKTLIIEHIDKLTHYDEFVFKCATNACIFNTLKNVMSLAYVSTNSDGKPSVSVNPSDVTTWLNILKPSVCYNWYRAVYHNFLFIILVPFKLFFPTLNADNLDLGIGDKFAVGVSL